MSNAFDNMSNAFDILSNTCDILCGNFDKEKKFPDKCQKYDIFSNLFYLKKMQSIDVIICQMNSRFLINVCNIMCGEV